jgi:hydroxymethylpyrimidine kinase/phosphomethylpyrimidine kinase
MISKHGAPLLPSDAVEGLKRRLIPRAFLLTPNLPEAEALTGIPIRSTEDGTEAGKRLLDLGCQAVLIKGGHAEGEPVDMLFTADGAIPFPGKRVFTKRTHGTGCTYSAAITACLAQGNSLQEAVRRAKRFIQAAIETAPALGQGHGPVNHFPSTSVL